MIQDQDVDARLDYKINWGPILDGDPIQTSDWFVSYPENDETLELSDQSFDDTSATVVVEVLSEFRAEALFGFYEVTNRITTQSDRQEDQSIAFRMVEK